VGFSHPGGPFSPQKRGFFYPCGSTIVSLREGFGNPSRGVGGGGNTLWGWNWGNIFFWSPKWGPFNKSLLKKRPRGVNMEKSGGKIKRMQGLKKSLENWREKRERK